MKVLGIAPSSTDFKWALLDGTRALPRILPLPSTSQKLPADACEGHALLSLRRLLSTFLAEQGVERICVAAGRLLAVPRAVGLARQSRGNRPAGGR